MAELISEEKKLVVKLVYYGPALSGKTTNLMRLHDLLAEGRRGDLMTFETKGDRTLFFDLLPLVARSESGFTVKFKLFTVPGQVAHDATRKAVLSRADGIVFVADSRNDQAMQNFASFDNLEHNARRVGLDLDHTPLVIQFNKRDLNDIVSEAQVRQRWQPTGLPIRFASALRGEGVRETFTQLLEQTHHALEGPFQLQQRHGIGVDHFLQVLTEA